MQAWLPEKARALSFIRSAEAAVDRSLRLALERMAGPKAQPRLREALEYALFPGGARLRPLLVLAVAESVQEGASARDATLTGAVAVELFHSGSLVHDDLPCFDDADLRRGKLPVHKRFDEATAVLVGDALIVHGFEALARTGSCEAVALGVDALGATRGLIAGQAWESEPVAPLDEYHRAKTASLFQASAALGALAAGSESAPWLPFGELVGRAYQAADDLSDAVGRSDESGKSVGRDAARGRPSIVSARGIEGARERVHALCTEAERAIPASAHADLLRLWLGSFRKRVDALSREAG